MKKLFAMTVAVLLLFSVLLGIPAAYCRGRVGESMT